MTSPAHVPAPTGLPTITFYVDFVSPYAWLAFAQLPQVLEGISVAIALTVADQLQNGLGLPPTAMSYLSSHGTLDQEHTKHLAALLEQMTPEDQADVLHAAKVFYKLYGDVFRALPTAKETPCN